MEETDFGWALRHLRSGYKLQRSGWNGKGIFIALQTPDENSKMSSPYIFIDTTGLQSDNPDAPRSRVPWLASQTDMLASDWQLVESVRRLEEDIAATGPASDVQPYGEYITMSDNKPEGHVK